MIAPQKAVTLTSKVSTASLHCTGWAGALSQVKMIGIRLRKITTSGS